MSTQNPDYETSYVGIQPTDAGSSSPKKPSSKKKWIIIGAIVAALLLVAAAIVGYSIYFKDKAVPGATVAGKSVTGMTASQVAEKVQKESASAAVRISGDATKSASLSDLGYKVDAKKAAAEALAPSQGFLSRLAGLFNPPSVTPTYSSTAGKVSAYAASLLGGAENTPVNAKVVLSEDGSAFQLKSGKPGRGINPDQLADAAQKAAKTLSSQAVRVKAVQSEPAITDQKAKPFLDKANKLVELPFTITYDSESYQPSAEKKRAWVDFGENGAGKQTAPKMNNDRVLEWVNKLAGQVSKAPQNGLKNVDSSGKTLATVREPEDGYTIDNASALAKAGTEALNSNKEYTGKFTSKPKKAEWETRTIARGAEKLAYPATEGEKWIDINLSNHTISAYQGAQMLRGPEPMVDGMPGYETIQGTFQIQRKYRFDDMRGEDYFTPDVPFAMYFSGGYAIHGAPWRGSFGYAGPSGSHGCVNLPVSLAGWYYEWAPVGTTTVVHY